MGRIIDRLFECIVDRLFNHREGYMGAKIRHIAIATQDPDTMAHFFKQALGLKQVGVANSDLATGYFLTDGYINLAILKFKSDYAAYTEGAPRYEGLHHFGFKVDNLEAVSYTHLRAHETPEHLVCRL